MQSGADPGLCHVEPRISRFVLAAIERRFTHHVVSALHTPTPTARLLSADSSASASDRSDAACNGSMTRAQRTHIQPSRPISLANLRTGDGRG